MGKCPACAHGMQRWKARQVRKEDDGMTLTEAAMSGDKRATLIALRDKIAETIENCESGRDMAANSKRLMEVIAELESLPDPSAKKESKHDKLKKKHENR